ncbi:MAG: ferritin family protein [Candidatus Cloacimonetes bacterium]|nr:ferritin family protein [Candidatus Cloacimonadota bacterium]
MTDFSVNEIIEMAIQIEKSGYAFYDGALQRKNLNEKGRELLLKLRDQERQHEITFNNLHTKDDFELLDLGSEQEVVSDYLKSIVNYRVFNNPNAAIKTVEQAKDELSLIETAINFEKDTLLYFQGIRDIIKESKAKDVLEKIIKEEISHILWLSLYRDKIIV